MSPRQVPQRGGGRPARPTPGARPRTAQADSGEGRRPRGGQRGWAPEWGQPRKDDDGRPRRPRGATVPKPPLPTARPRVDRSVHQDLRGAAPPGLLDDVIKAYAAAGEALTRGQDRKALEYLEWAKSVAGRSAVVREALGVVRYRMGDFAVAAAELTAYRRMTGRQDQNHLLADCARATGRTHKVEEYVRAMQDNPQVPRDRVIEGIIVLAGDVADRAGPQEALDVLREVGLEPERVEAWHPRLWYAAADFAHRAGDSQAARDYLAAVVSVDEDFLDAAQRLATLDGPDA